jgi:nitrogen fixation protein NifB
MIYEVDGVKARFIAHRKIDHYCLGGYSEEGSLQNIIKAISDCKAVLVSKIGDGPKEKILDAGLEVVEAYDVIETVALEYYKQLVEELQGV